ncbi:MAG: ribosome silencing factor [Planctomycetaceae bacterium]
MAAPLRKQIKADVQTAILCAQLCDGLRGTDTVVLDLTEITPLFDFFIVTTANNRRQMLAIADEISKTLKGRGHKRLGIEGYDTSSWIVEDFGDIVVHVFTDETRGLYDLDNLWGDAPRIDWQASLASSPAALPVSVATASETVAVESDGADAVDGADEEE